MKKIAQQLVVMSFLLASYSALAAETSLSCLAVFDGVHHPAEVSLTPVDGQSYLQFQLSHHRQECSGYTAGVPNEAEETMYVMDCSNELGTFKLYQNSVGSWRMTRDFPLIGGIWTFDFSCTGE